jgi:hypothetical protein
MAVSLDRYVEWQNNKRDVIYLPFSVNRFLHTTRNNVCRASRTSWRNSDPEFRCRRNSFFRIPPAAEFILPNSAIGGIRPILWTPQHFIQ